MTKATLIAALLLTASPVAAQSPQQPLGAAGQTNTSSLPNTGVICQEEMTATFCNVPTSQNASGYGSGGGGSGSSSGAGIERRRQRRKHHVHSSMRSEPPANVVCD